MTEREIFFEALEMATPEARAAYLQGACGPDVTLRRKVDELLKEHFSNDSLLAGPALEGGRAAVAESTADEAPAQMIGRYKLLEKIGEGGFGEVWMAEQREPVKRRVALKIIKLGMDSRQIVARFEAERQALAMMDHPNIAKIFDAGTTETPHPVSDHPLPVGRGEGRGEGPAHFSVGRLYFVMELVRGIKITEYCDQNQLPTLERLRLFILVCQAIQHAHQKGIIHRDIKPSNILVTLHDGVPVPKVIDFGIAKATQGELTDKTVFTQFQQFIGTPAYISPEQAEMSGLDIDTRADIYSLGVLLYELLVGQTPFDAKEMMQGGLDALRQIIREKEPLRPSTRLNTLQGDARTTAGKRRQTDVGKLVHQLQGDLDWIVMKCLEKDRTRRYETANGLAADIQRHLANEPVVARPPSAAYKYRKAWRRNKVIYSAGMTVALALLIGIAVSVWQAAVANLAKMDALRAKGEAERAELEALDQKAEAESARQLAEANAQRARLTAYASDMNLAKQAIDGSDFGRAMDILDRHRPKEGQTDLRGWEWRYLWQFCRSDALRTITQLPAISDSVHVSADGQLVAATTGRPSGVTVARINGPVSPEVLADDLNVWRLAFHPSRPWLAVSGNTTAGALEIRLLDASTGSLLWSARSEDFLRAPGESRRADILGKPAVREGRGSDQCFGLGFLAGGERLLAYLGGKPTQLMIFETATGKVSKRHATRHNLVSSEAKPDSFVVTPDGTRCLIATHENGIEAVDLESGQSVWHTQIGKVFNVLACSENGQWLAGADDGDNSIQILEVATGERIGKPLVGHDGWIGGLQFTESDQTLVSCEADQVVRVWDWAKRKASARLIGSRQELWGLRRVPGSSRIVTGGKDGKLMLWDARAPSQPRDHVRIPREIRGVRVLEGVQAVRTLDVNGAVEEWRAPGFLAPVKLFQFPGSPGHGSISADGDLLAVAVAGAGVELWRLSEKQRIPVSRGDIGEVFLPVFIENGDLYLIQFDHRIVRLKAGVWTQVDSWQWDRSSMTGGTDRAGQWNIQTRPAQGNEVHLQMTLRNLETGAVTTHRTGPGTYSSSFCAAFSWDGLMVGVPAEPGLVVVHTVPEMKEIRRFGGHRHGAKSVGFSRDGSRVATGSIGRETLKLWDWESGLELLTLGSDNRGHFAHIYFSSDGNLILLHSGNDSAYLWRAPSFEEIAAAEAKEKTEIKLP